MAAKKKTRSTAKRTTRSKRVVDSEKAGSGRVHLYVGISLDGYIATPDGGVDWLDPYADAHAGYASFIKTIGSAIMGRATWDFAVAHGFKGSREMPSYVLTHRPFESPSEFIIPYNGSARDVVAHIRARHSGDIWLMGGGVVTKEFQDADLIDLWSIGYVPTLLGDGIPMFPRSEFRERRLRLISNRVSKSGVIEVRYERLKMTPTRTALRTAD